ncbi:hypothetical protein EV148_101733 [Dokdonella fugitiva]|jgi:hypothetical protein|uniref:Uncharacterized protein n=1 Tax=Dokdonella fugitiva TaxID=328517 RepID=A0A4V2S377_9GAMM|nr:hypothetical protein [Dokdonella fugitiva]TCO43310.1 hypothetical protein EV148_101733 [Dokdonella fugitiva]
MYKWIAALVIPFALLGNAHATAPRKTCVLQQLHNAGAVQQSGDDVVAECCGII